MRVPKNTIYALSKSAVVLLLVSLQSCSTYNTKTTIEGDLFSGDFNKAIEGIDKNKFLLKDRNKLLYLMEKGKIEHLRGNYEKSNALFEQAYIMIDDKIKTNVGQAIAGKFTNPMAEPYKGEDFEKVTIHYYMALNYFHLGMPNEALVEAKRINIKLLELNEKYPENKNKYSRDAFSQILQGLIYESTGDINNAFIAYRNAEEIYDRDKGTFFGVSMPEQLKKDLVRTSKLMGFREEYQAYLKKFNMLPPPSDTNSTQKPKKGAKAPTPETPAITAPTGEAVVFWENGLGPAKDQIMISVSNAGPFFYGSYMDGDIVEEIIIPIPIGSNIGSINAIAIPKYRKRDTFYSKATIVVDGKEQPFELGQDFNSIAKQCLKDRMLREVIDLAARFAVKKASSAGLGALGKELFGDTGGDLMKLGGDIAGAATEKADTRNWQSLPATICYTRIPLKEGENKFVIKKYGPQGIVDTDTLNIPYRKGLQIVNYFDLGRTQVISANSKAVTLSNTSAVSSINSPEAKQSASLVAVDKPAVQSMALAKDNTGDVNTAMDSKISEKYDKWVDLDNGISYKVSYKMKNFWGKQLYGKTVSLKSTNPEKTKVTFAVTEQPMENGCVEVSGNAYYKHLGNKEIVKEYYTLTEKLKPNKVTNATTVYNITPDFYVTILKIE